MKMAMKDGKIMLIEVDNTQMAIIKSWDSMKYDRRKNMMIGQTLQNRETATGHRKLQAAIG